MIKFFIILFIFCFSFHLKAEDSLLTLKQKLDRLQRDVNDISKTVFQSSRDESLSNDTVSNDNSDLTAFDLRIYDLEKDIKRLNANIEEIIFKIDDMQNYNAEISAEISDLKLTIQNIKKESNSKDDSNNNLETNSLNTTSNSNEENSLGNLVISSNDLSDQNQKIIDQDTSLAEESTNSSPEEDFQKAFDLLRGQQFDDAKLAFKDYIKNYENNKLAGSAHYWLGELYLLKKDYRDAALILAEGYQKFPKSVKAPEMLYKLSEALMSIDKKNDACGTLNKLIKDFPNNKIIIKTEDKLKSYECLTSTE